MLSSHPGQFDCLDQITPQSVIMKAIKFLVSLCLANSARSLAAVPSADCPNVTRLEAESFISKFSSVLLRTGGGSITALSVLSQNFTLVSNSLLSLQDAPVSIENLSSKCQADLLPRKIARYRRRLQFS